MILEVDRVEGVKDYEVPKHRNLESVSAKNKKLFLPCACIPAHRTHRPSTMSVSFDFFALFPSHRGHRPLRASVSRSGSLVEAHHLHGHGMG
jgi:hypothetical protein